MVFQTEDTIHLLIHRHTLDDFILHLFLRHENVRIILREATYTEKAMERALQLMAMNKAEFADTHRQISVRTLLRLEEQDSAGAVHRFDRIVFVIDLGEVHIFLVMIPVTRLQPQLLRQDDRRHDLHIAEFLEELTLIVHQFISEDHALRVEEREARALFMEGEQIELLAELSVIALLRLCTDEEIVVKILLAEECRRIDTLQHLILGVAAPVSASDRHQLERLHLAGGLQMRARAEIREVTLFIERDRFLLRQVFDQHDLVVLAFILEILERFIARQHLLHQRDIFLRDLRHLLLDRCEILLAENMVRVQIIVEAIIDRRSDSKLHAREQVLDRLRHHMGRRMTQREKTFRILLREEFHLCTIHDRIAQIRQLAIHLRHQCILAKAVGDRLRCIRQRYRALELLLFSVFQTNRNHSIFLSKNRHSLLGDSGFHFCCFLLGSAISAASQKAT